MRTAKTVVRRDRWPDVLGWAAGVAVLVPVLGLLVYVSLIAPTQEGRDVAAAPRRAALVRPQHIVFTTGSRLAVPSGWTGTVRLEGRPVRFTLDSRARPNGKMRATYRIGRSGRIYLEALEPAAGLGGPAGE